jgi:transcriptional regulator with XRE-family HTH domain
MPKFVSFAERLRSLRQKAGISQYRLAQQTGLTKQAVSRLESEQDREPNWSTVQLLAVALGVSCEEFMDPAVRERVQAAPPPGKRGRPPKATPATPPAEDLEATAKKHRSRRRKGGSTYGQE